MLSGAREHYVFAEAYDERYRGRSEDIAFYRRYARAGDRVLEYGAGTGRLTLPLLEGGANVTAVDASATMLEGLTRRCERFLEARTLRVRCADMRTFRTKTRFEVVVCGFHTFCHLYSLSDVRAFLARVREHLVPGGVFVFDVPMPHVDAPGYDVLSQICVTEMDGPRGSELLTQRWYSVEELRMHLHYAGFAKPRFFGDFERTGPTSDSDFVQIVVRSPDSGRA